MADRSEITNEWKAISVDTATVIRCPKCNALIDKESVECRNCGLEIKCRVYLPKEIIVLVRDPDYVEEI